MGSVIIKDGQPFIGADNLDPAKIKSLIDDGTWTEEDLKEHGLDAAIAFVVPDDKMVMGSPKYSFDGKQWIETYDVVDKPLPQPEPELTPEERLFASTGLTVDDLKKMLGV